MAKYLDQSGLSYLWSKIKENFTNVIEEVKVNGTALTVENKSVNVVIPAATVTGVKSGEKVISLDGTELQSTLGLVYDSSAKTITLQGIDGAEIAQIDTTDFVVDGMLEDVELSGNTLIFTFNTDAGEKTIEVDLSKYIDVYTAGNGIDIDGREISVKLAETQGNAVLSFVDGGLKAEIDLSDYATTADTAALEAQISAETAARVAAVAAEAEARAEAVAAAESAATAAVAAEAAAREAAVAAVESAATAAVAAEAAAREAAISAETAARVAAVAAEAAAREAAISALTESFDEAIADVESAMTAADAALDGRLDLLEGSAATWNNTGAFAVKAEGAEVAGYEHNQSSDTFVDIVGGNDILVSVSGSTISIAADIEALSNAEIDAAIASGSTL